ncbi:zinc ribbon domain-containing protein [Candidatus Bathyarchaeota archaeon]|nr:zinc ribbon domain-containing protein [Candidatus Bathyarchaeota archaeon]
MPYCPRCGVEVSEDTLHCPRCGSEIRYSAVTSEPEREGVVEHLRYAIDVARAKPIVFGPSLVEVLIAFANGRILDSWGVFQEFIEELIQYFQSQTGVMPVAYTYNGFEFDFTRFIAWVPVLMFALSLVSWVASLASIKVSWSVVRGEDPDIQGSFVFIGRRIVRFVYASILSHVFYAVVFGVAVGLILAGNSIGVGPAYLLSFIIMMGVLVVWILAGPVFILMVGDDAGFISSLKASFSFSRGRLDSYIGISLLLFLVGFGLTMIPTVGTYLTFISGVMWNLAMIDLYNQYKAGREL